MLKDAECDFVAVSTGKFRRYFSMQNFTDIIRIVFGYFGSYKILRKYKPNVVFSKGGFVSVPIVFASKVLGIPIVIHESDVSPGLSNRICFRFATKVCLSFEESKKFLPKGVSRKIFVGSPIVRPEILSGDENLGYKFVKFDRYRPVILVMGGSQGSMQINNLVRISLDELLKKFQIVHVVGGGNIDISLHKKGYTQYEFLNEQLKDVYAMAKLVVTRGGANSLAELAILGKRVVVIPLGGKASRGEQVENARYYANRFAFSVLEGEVDRKNFMDAIVMSLQNADTTRVGKLKNGLKDVVKIILDVGKN